MAFINFSLLKQKDFCCLYLSQFISLFGSQMTMITIPFQVYNLTGSTFQTGLVSVIELLCLLSTVIWGGVLADKLDRRKIIINSEWSMIGLVGLLAVNALLPAPFLAAIYVMAGLLAAVSGFHRPAFEALTPLLVPKEKLSQVSPLLSFKYTIAAIAGPALAGILVAQIGPFCTYGCNILTFLVSLSLLLRISQRSFKEETTEGAKESSWLKEISGGVKYLYTRRDLLGSYMVDFCAMVFCMPQVLFPAFAQKYDHNEWLGALYMSVALGSMTAALVSGWTPKIQRHGVAISCAAFGWAFFICNVSWFPYFWAIPVCLFCAGICDCYSGIFRSTMWNESIPDQYRGRLSSFNMLSYMSGPLLGNAVIGFLGDRLGLHEALAWGGATSICLVILTAWFLPDFWSYRSDRSVETKSVLTS